jgi:hypothetical protein
MSRHLIRCAGCHKERPSTTAHCLRCHHAYATQAALESHQLHGHRQEAVSGDRSWSAMSSAQVAASLKGKP